MNKYPRVLVFFVMFITLQINAQDTRPLMDYFYADVKLGIGFHNEPYSGSMHTPISIGYRINQNHAVGITRHFTVAGLVSSRILRYTGYAIEYRYATKTGLVAKVATGLVTGAYGGSNYGWSYEYTEGGYFGGLSIEYQLRFGLTFGAFISTARNMSFDDYYLADDTDELVYHNTEKRNLTTGGFTLGYAIPWRKRRTQ